MSQVAADDLFITLALRQFGPDPQALASFLPETPQSVTLHLAVAGQNVKLTVTPSTDNGILTLDVAGVVVDRVKMPASWAERLVAHFAAFPGLSYQDGKFYLALPLHLRGAGVQMRILFVEV